MLLSILFILIILVFFTLFLLPYDMGTHLEKENESTVYIIFIRSWRSIMGIAWRKEDDVQYIRFEILKIAFQKKLGSRQAKQNKKLDEQSVPRKKDKMKKRRLYCIIANAVIHSPKWFLRFVGILHLKNFEIRGHLGVGDPACTGLVYGLLQSLYPFNWRCVHLSVTPYFCGRKYNGSIKLVFQLYFFQLLGSLLQAGIHFLWIFGRCHFNMKGRFAW